MHALLYLIISLLAVAVVFFMLGAPFIAALEVIIYAGAVMVLFIFVVMMFNLGAATSLERLWLTPRTWVGPTVLAAILLAEVIVMLAHGGASRLAGRAVDPHQVAVALYQPYLLGVELASFLLLAGLVGAYHLGARRATPPSGRTT